MNAFFECFIGCTIAVLLIAGLNKYFYVFDKKNIRREKEPKFKYAEPKDFHPFPKEKDEIIDGEAYVHKFPKEKDSMSDEKKQVKNSKVSGGSYVLTPEEAIENARKHADEVHIEGFGEFSEIQQVEPKTKKSK